MSEGNRRYMFLLLLENEALKTYCQDHDSKDRVSQPPTTWGIGLPQPLLPPHGKDLLWEPQCLKARWVPNIFLKNWIESESGHELLCAMAATAYPVHQHHWSKAHLHHSTQYTETQDRYIKCLSPTRPGKKILPEREFIPHKNHLVKLALTSCVLWIDSLEIAYIFD